MARQFGRKPGIEYDLKDTTMWTNGQAVSFFASFASLVTCIKGTIVPPNPAKNITWPYHTFKSANFTPPVLNITHHTAPSEGYLFFAPDGATEFQLAPFIMDMYGRLIWQGPTEHAFNFGVQEYQGEPVLVWWNGTLYPEPVGRGNGEIYVFNNEYEQIEKVTLAGDFLELTPGLTFPSNIDLHELLLTKNGSVILTANNVTQANLSSVGGPPNGWTVDSRMYEIDVATNKVLFEWSALDNLDQIPYNITLYYLGAEGYTGENQSTAWDYFHINSVDTYDGGYLVNSRYTASAFAIDAKDGRVKCWLSGVNGGDFKLVGSNGTTGFRYQHDMRVLEETASGVTLSMHDNHNSPIENNTVPSTAKAVAIDFDTKEVTLKHRFLNDSGPVFSTAQGNYQLLDTGNLFVGHGWIPILEEFSSSGEILTTIQFGVAVPRPGGGYESPLKPTLSYRGFKQHWVGCPKTKPDLVVESSEGSITLYVSWNGATEVEAWEIYAGSSKQELKCLRQVPKKGFETEVTVKKVGYVQVKPIMKQGCPCKQTVDSAVVAVS